ncbi:MAG: hypothetical protein GY716_04550, partial [bacterium]|nr:hypothetical protein [bacterium]
MDEVKEMKVPVSDEEPALCFLELKRHYEREDEITVNALWAQLERCKMGNLSFDSFYQQLTILFSRLAAAGDNVPVGKQKRCLMTGVTRDANSVTTMMENRAGLTFDEMATKFREFYERRDLQARYEPEDSVVRNPPLAFPAATSADVPLCSACRKGHHRQEDCWKLHPEKRPERFMRV